MDAECQHADLIDITALGNKFYNYLCAACGARVTGEPIAPVDELRAHQAEELFFLKSIHDT